MKKASSLQLFLTAIIISCTVLSVNAAGISNYNWNLPNTTGASASTPAPQVNQEVVPAVNKEAEPAENSANTLAPAEAATVPEAQIQTEQKALSEGKTDTEMAETITRIGNKILEANKVTEKITFKVVSLNEANAATDAQNIIYVYTGLLKYCTSDDELAFVIGHEIGHALKNHVIKSVAIDTIAGVGNQVANNIAANQIAKTKLNSKLNQWGFGNVLTKSASTAINATTAAGVAKLNRGQETDSDILGLILAVNAGYNPNASYTILEKIGDNYVDFFENHPSTDKRVETLKKYISEEYPDYAK